ncbi:MAG: hypothetical protein RL077_403, partial [Verrucomicrobiota bacterium]
LGVCSPAACVNSSTVQRLRPGGAGLPANAVIAASSAVV